MDAKHRKLNAAIRTFIVIQIACYATPKETAEAVHEEFGLEITPQNVEKYDPTKYSGREVAKKWRELFEKTRVKFLKHVDQYVPEVNKAVRLRQLANAARAFKGHGNYVGMANIFEQIAKEIGNAFTNRRELSGKGGRPIEFREVDMMTEQQVDDELRGYGFDPDIHPAPTRQQ